MKIHNSTAMVGFTSLRGLVIDGTRIRLREKKLSDARSDYRWQSDPELSELDANPPLVMSYAIYLLDYSLELRAAGFRRFPLSVDTLDGIHIGNCTIYDIDEKKSEAQFGIMIGERDYWDKGYGTDATTTIVDYVFRTTTLRRLYLKTLTWNTRAQKCFSRCGFTFTGIFTRNSHEFHLMELTRARWMELRGTEAESALNS